MIDEELIEIGAADLPSDLPMFPLRGGVLLPGGELPLTIVEPQHRAMMADALDGSRMIALVQPRQERRNATDAGDGDGETVYQTGCVGYVVSCAEAEEGYVITLAGVCRFRIAEELPRMAAGYRRVAVDYAPFTGDLAAPEEGIEDRARLLAALDGYLQARGLDMDVEDLASADDEALVTGIAMTCPLRTGELQALLESRDLAERGRLLTALLEMESHGWASGGPLPH